MYFKLLSICLLVQFVFGDKCQKFETNSEVNTHFWKYYEDLDDTYFFFKNESTSAWIVCCTKFPVTFFSKGNIFDNPILALDTQQKKVYESKYFQIDEIIDTKLVNLLEKIPENNKAHSFKNADKCFLEDFQKVHESVSFSGGASASLENLTKLKIDYITSITKVAKGFYTKQGSISMKKDKDIIWVVTILKATAKLLESNPGILDKLMKEKKFKPNFKRIFDASNGTEAIKALIEDVKKVEKITKVFGNKNEAKPRIIAAIKLFPKEDEKSPEEEADEILKKYF